MDNNLSDSNNYSAGSADQKVIPSVEHKATSLVSCIDNKSIPQMFAAPNLDKRISSTIFDVCFVTIKAGVKLDELTGRNIQAISNGDAPWAETIVEKPYWKDRSYSKLKVGVFGALPNTDDRHLLDTVIGLGTPIKRSRIVGSTVRDVLWSWERSNKEKKAGAQIEFDTRDSLYRSENLPRTIPFENLYPQTKMSLDDRVFNGNINYLVVSIKHINVLFGKTRASENKDHILSKLSRLAMVSLKLTTIDDNDQDTGSVFIRLLDPFIYPFCDTTCVPNVGTLVPGKSVTHVLLGVSSQYYGSLTNDSTIPRSKLIESYVGFKNVSHILDFVKYLESNRDGFFHNYTAKSVILKYLKSKVLTSLSKNPAGALSKQMRAILKVLDINKDGIIERIEEITGYAVRVPDTEPLAGETVKTADRLKFYSIKKLQVKGEM